jgi:hypothetical protein
MGDIRLWVRGGRQPTLLRGERDGFVLHGAFRGWALAKASGSAGVGTRAA